MMWKNCETKANARRSDRALFRRLLVESVYLKETRETVSKDSVRIGKQGSLGNKFDVYGTVEADLRIFSKTVESGGLLDVLVINPNTDRFYYNKKFQAPMPGSMMVTIKETSALTETNSD